MGYSTEFDLKVTDKQGHTIPENLSDEMDTAVRDMSNLDWYDRGEWGGFEHWYEWKSDMKEFSVKYPDCVFVLKGRGEEIDDEWVALFLDGEMNFIEIGEMVGQWVEQVTEHLTS